MKSLHKTLVMALVMASSLPNWAGGTRERLSLRHIKAVRPDTTLNLLDSIVSDNYRRIYQYNEYGYITSMKVYNKAADWELDTEQSYEQTYAFNASGQCTERVQYSLKPNGQRNQMIDKGAIEQENDYTWERYWSMYNGRNYLRYASAYDPWGNEAISASYTYDSGYEEAYLNEYEETRYDYSRPLPPTNHKNYERFKEAAFQYRIKGHEHFEYDIESDKWKKVFQVHDSRKVTREMGNGTLTISTFYLPWDESFSLKEAGSKWKASEYDYEKYTLNADGTRPVACSRGNRETETWLWDDKGRLTKHTDENTTTTYTYADDYAPQHSLQELMDCRNGLVLYPEEDNDCFLYGHVATYRNEDKWGYEEQNAEYDQQGRLACVHYTEVTFPNANEGGNEQSMCQGTITYHYRADGHLDHETDISNEDGNTYYLKTVYTYDDMGTWIGLTEYEGESENGPWHKTYSPSKSHRQANMRRQMAKHHIGENMGEGSHEIDETEGVWARRGHYYVENGEIAYGEYREWLVNDAHVPSDPELNYTDPTMPLDYSDEWGTTVMDASWIYEWDGDTKMWTLKSAPDHAYCTYKDGMQVKRDRYNSEKEITMTDTYSFDNDGRLTRHETDSKEMPQGSNYIEEYTYLTDGSDYLSTRHTHNTMYDELRHYYYSNHQYVAPTGIDGVNAAGKTGNQYYDLQGRKVSHPSRGIYIRQGRKVAIK